MGRLVKAAILLLMSFVISCGDASPLDNEEFGVSATALTFSNGLTTPIASMSAWENGNFAACGSSYWTGRCHVGNDIEAPVGTPVHAVAAGTLIAISATQDTNNDCLSSGWGYDYYHNVDNPNGTNTCNMALAILHYNASGQPFVSVYGHMRYNPNLPIGTRFTAGSVIGVVGRYYHTYNAPVSGDHLHWGIKPGSSAPTSWGRTSCPYNQGYDQLTFPSGCSSAGFVAPGTYMLTNFPQSLPYNYSPNAYMCPGPVTGGANTNWVYSCGTPRVTYTQGETVYGMIHIDNIQPNTSFRYKVRALKNDSLNWEWTAGWNNTGSGGWDKSYFWPSMVNAQPGNWAFQFWVDTGAGFKLVDTQYFAVLTSATPYTYDFNSVTCRGPITGGASTNWVYTCENPTSTFSLNDPMTTLIRINNIGADFRWQTKIYANDVLQWTDTTGWNDVGEGGWEKAYYWPTTGSVWLTGVWRYDIYIDAGSGFQYITSTYSIVN